MLYLCLISRPWLIFFNDSDTVILGDTYDSETLLLPSKGADVVVHECTILEEDASEAVKRYHSTASECKREFQ